MSAPGRPGLAGAVALVTGASGGIGGAVAAALAAEGARTVLVGRRREALEAAAGPDGVAEVVDLEDDEAVLALAGRVLGEHERLDVLVHAAAAIELGPLADAPVAELDRQYRVNVRAPYVLTQALLPALVASAGQVVFVNSTAGRSAGPGSSQYAATKHALRALADALRAEVNEHGVRVVSVFPGRTATPMQAWIHEHEGRPYRPERLLQPADVAATVVAALTAPATAEVTDVFVRPMLKPAP